MSPKYNEYTPMKKPRRERKVHPIWRGVGCLLVFLVPVVSYAAAAVLIDKNKESNWFPVPTDPEFYANSSQITWRFIQDPDIYIKIILAVAIAFIFYALFTLLTFILNSAFGVTNRNDPYYVPPMTRKPRRIR